MSAEHLSFDEVLPAEAAQWSKPDQLADLLQAWNVPVEQWGQGKAKTFDHLLKEVQTEECALVAVETEHGSELIRRSRVAAIDVFYTAPDGEEYRLVEDRQVFKDGRTKTRPHVTTSLGEKLKADEDGDEAAFRAVHEELGFSPESVTYLGSDKIRKESNSYPGLNTELALDYYRCAASDATYRPEGYVERQADKDVYFVWQQDTPIKPQH